MSAFFVLTTAQLQQLVHDAAERYAQPTEIVAAVVNHESAGGDVWAWNPEPKYRWFWDVRGNKPFRHADGNDVTAAEVACKIPPKDFRSASVGVDPDAEWWGQQASWGLMQIMGAVARERGFMGKFLNALHDPVINLDLGCKHLAAYAKLYLGRFGWPGVLRAYNGGPYAALYNTNPQYPEFIRKLLPDGKFPDA